MKKIIIFGEQTAHERKNQNKDYFSIGHVMPIKLLRDLNVNFVVLRMGVKD
jgi:hypothetical protein